MSTQETALHVHQVLHTTPVGSKAHDFFKRMLCNFAVNLKAIKGANHKDSCILWNTYKNLLLWFDYWARNLVKLGFAYHNSITNKICIPKEQLTNIVNFNETCLSLDGRMQNCGGQPEVILHDPRFPQVGQATSKSSLTTTMITGNNVSGDPIPPHLQFQSKAKTKEAMKLQYDVTDHMPYVHGQFGCDEVHFWPVKFGTNEKGEMDNE